MKRILYYFFISQFVSSTLYALTLGVVPQQSPIELMKVWSPIVKYLEKKSGVKVTLKIESSIPKFEKVLYAGGYDIAYMNPYHYTIAHKKQNYIAAVRAKKNIVGILVVNKNSGITDISKTKGKTFLFPAPNAFAATLLTKYELLTKFNIDVDKSKKLHYVNSHDSVYKGIARGIGDVGGGIERTLNALDDKISKDSLIILYRTQAYPSHPFAFKGSMPKGMKDKFLKLLLNIPKNILKPLRIKKIIKTDDIEYDIVRDIAKRLSIKKD
jgi:phosphonate transport system substrate-binding protein